MKLCRLAAVVFLCGFGCSRCEPPAEPAPVRVPAPAYLGRPPDRPMPGRLSETGAFADTAALNPAAFLIAYDVNVPFWSGPADKRRWIAVPGDERIRFSAAGAWRFPPGTVFVKH